MEYNFSTSAVLFLSVLSVAQAAKILGVFPMPVRSHHILGHSLMKGLAERGHEVVIITPYPEKVSRVKYRQVLLTGFVEAMQSNHANLFEKLGGSSFSQSLFVKSLAQHLTRQVYEHPHVKKLLSSNETFDAVIVEQFYTEALKGLAWYYKAPLILFSTIGANTWFNGLVGNPSPPSYIPEAMSEFTDEMSYFERFENTFIRVFTEFLLNFLVYPAHDKILHDYLPSAPHINDILYNTSLVLINSDVSFNQAVPRVPNMIDIGGFHVQPPKKIPKDLQNFLDDAKEGVVYFSMGSNLKSAQLPNSTRVWLLRVFSKLKQKVLWKFEDEMIGKPKNLEIRNWMPQQDILGHPNVKLFITHGGLLSTTETVYHGLPILAIPVFGDQRLNAARAAKNGIGLYIYYTNLTEEYFEECLHQLLNNKTYSERAKQISRMFQDRPMKPMDTANFWVEYVIRHQGAPHLRISSLKLNIFQYLLLDIIAGVIVLIIFILATINYLYGILLKHKEKKKKIKKQ